MMMNWLTFLLFAVLSAGLAMIVVDLIAGNERFLAWRQRRLVARKERRMRPTDG